jgi:hypothetical protein
MSAPAYARHDCALHRDHPEIERWTSPQSSHLSLSDVSLRTTAVAFTGLSGKMMISIVHGKHLYEFDYKTAENP